MPLISIAIPCYNVALYLERAITSILEGAEKHLDQVEIILIDDGSTGDETPELVDAWAARYPQLIRAIHQANGGHGEAVNTGLAAAKGDYFKVLDADDWFDSDALAKVMRKLYELREMSAGPDLLIANYVYEKLEEGTHRRISFVGVFPEGRLFGWNDVGHFQKHQNLLMHTAIYRTELLRSIGLNLPAHTFYVDNIFVFVPLPAVKTLYYLDIDLYRYYIGREGQSVQEKTMIKRIDQQLRVTHIMIDAYKLQTVEPRRLRLYMTHYMLMMMTISSVFLRLSDLPNREQERKMLWEYLRQADPDTYNRLRGSGLGVSVNLPGKFGRSMAIAGYRIVQKIFKFN
ncbi:MAG: glycosyltransferase [Actinomycetia bacterium]|nr:glycosyltransferase [Actinomycetes bacterium]